MTSLTCSMVFLKARVLAHFSLQFMQADCLMSSKSTLSAQNEGLCVMFKPMADPSVSVAIIYYLGNFH